MTKLNAGDAYHALFNNQKDARDNGTYVESGGTVTINERADGIEVGVEGVDLRIDTQPYSHDGTTKTLTPGDATYPRQDVVRADADGITVETGEPGPALPDERWPGIEETKTRREAVNPVPDPLAAPATPCLPLAVIWVVPGARSSGQNGDVQPGDKQDVRLFRSANVDVAGALDAANDYTVAGMTVEGTTDTDSISVNRCLSRMWSSSEQTTADSTFEQLEFGRTTTDSLGGVDLTNNQITVPAAGTYALILNVRMSGVPNASRVIPRIDAGNEEVARADSHSSTTTTSILTGRVSDTRELAANESVTGLLWQDTGGQGTVRAGENETFFTVSRVG